MSRVGFYDAASIQASLERANLEAINEQLRGELSIAEDGLANYAQENQKLRDCWAEALGNYAKQNVEVERLRTALSGIASCSTCAACRGAAEIALGDVPQPDKHGG